MNNIIPFAHRGHIGAAPENTLPAFEYSAKHGCSVEMDIQLTLDGEIVVYHDSDLTRLCLGNEFANIKTKISQMTYEEICAVNLPYAGHLLEYFPLNGFENEAFYYYPWALDTSENILKSAEEVGCINDNSKAMKLLEKYKTKYETAYKLDPRSEKIMHFRDFLNWVKLQDNSFMAEIEYKCNGLDRKVYDMIEEAGVASKCILMSGVVEYNTKMQDFAKANGKPKNLKLAANIRYLTDEHKDMIRDWDLYEVGLNAEKYDIDDVNYLKERGIKVFSNLGDKPSWWSEMQENGTFAFKTNCLDKYLNWLKKD